MAPAIRALIIVVCLTLFVGNPTGSDANARLLTVDDVLKTQDVGRGIADPSGRLIVWEQSPPYDQLGDYSVGRIGTWEGAFQLMSFWRDQPKAMARPLFPADLNCVYWIDAFSPSGRYLSFFYARKGHFGVGLFDTRQKTVRYINRVPTIDWLGRVQSAWISDDEYVFSASLDGEVPEDALRRSFGERMWAAWNKSWLGRQPSSTTVSSSPNMGSTKLRDGELVLISTKFGSTKVLAAGQFVSLTVSPDGRQLAALRQAERPQPSPTRADIDWTDGRSQLVVFGIGPKVTTSIYATGMDVYPDTLAWSHNSGHLAFFAWKGGAGVQSGLFRALDVKSGALTDYPHVGLNLASERERGWRQKPEHVVWIGDKLAMFARENATGDDQPKFTYRDMTGVGSPIAKPDWFLVDQKGAHQNLTSPFSVVSAVPLDADGISMSVLADGKVWRLRPGMPPTTVSHASHALFLTRDDDDVRYQPTFRSQATFLGRQGPGKDVPVIVHNTSEVPGQVVATEFVDLRVGNSAELPIPAGNVELIAGSPRSRIALLRIRNKGTDSLVLQSGESARVVGTLNHHLTNVVTTNWQLVQYNVALGAIRKVVQACILLPPDYKLGQPYPMIVDVYPSVGAASCLDPRRNANGATQDAYSMHLLAAHGYVVFRPNTEREIIRTSDGPLSAMPSAVLQGVDALVKRGLADPTRLGLIGYSQGGFSSLWLASKTSRFKAVVSINGWADLYTHYYEANFTNRVDPEAHPYVGNIRRYLPTVGTDFPVGVTPRQNPGAYLNNSPLYLADDIQTPILLIHSDMDSFNLDQYEAMFTALYLKRKDAKLVIYWGEGHAPSSPANIRDMWTNIFDWFDRRLMPHPISSFKVH